jgi:hypothetical protein
MARLTRKAIPKRRGARTSRESEYVFVEKVGIKGTCFHERARKQKSVRERCICKRNIVLQQSKISDFQPKMKFYCKRRQAYSSYIVIHFIGKILFRRQAMNAYVVRREKMADWQTA